MVDVVLAVIPMDRDLFPNHKGEISHLKEHLTLHTIDASDGLCISDFQLIEKGDVIADLRFQIHDLHHGFLQSGFAASFTYSSQYPPSINCGQPV